MATERPTERTSPPRRWPALAVVAASGLAATGCTGGMLDPSSPRADRVVTLWWVMFGISAVVMALVLTVLIVGLIRASRPDAPEREDVRGRDRVFVFGGGIALPVAVMVVLMVLTVWSGREITEGAGEEPLVIEVSGRQWWWELRYPGAGFVTANEIHIPVGEPVELVLLSEDVIHSFWAPSLSGKIDLIPGRENTLVIEASEPGTYRGQCAEFCGLQHAKMRFRVIAQEREEFDRWLADQAAAAQPLPGDNELLARGQEVFRSAGCVTCHTVRGTDAAGQIGPDLTHIASRTTLAAGVIPNTRDHLAGWILDPQSVKPGTQMPPNSLPPEQLEALLAYLESLE